MTDWRNELIKDMINAMYKVENMQCSKLLVMARAALAVAEPVIREQADNALREENARLWAVIQFILDNQISERRSEHIDCVIIHGEPIRAARAAIREGDPE